MIGFFCVFDDSGNVEQYTLPGFEMQPDHFLCDEIRNNSLIVRRNLLKKFSADKAWLKQDGIWIFTDGVFLNSNSIEKETGLSLPLFILDAYRNDNLSRAVDSLRGSFSGILVDLGKKRLTVFTDHFASRPLFFMPVNHGIVVSSEVRQIADFCRANRISYTLSYPAAYSMLTYGYMYGDYTLIEEARRIREGTIFQYSNGQLCFECYHELRFDPVETTPEEAVDRIDTLFRQAVLLQGQKNISCGYENVIPLSAGMDCRMTSYVFNNIFKQHAVNFTYSETGEYDFIEGAKMAHELRNRWIFKSLDHGLDLYNIEGAVRDADGLIYYAWPSQLGDFLRLVNTEKWGIIHTGVLGDVVIGSYMKAGWRERYKLGDGAYSSRLLEKLRQYLEIDEVGYEKGMIQNRGINGVCLGYSLTFRHYAEDLSPFLNVDFFDYCMSIPVSMRQSHDLYYTWVGKYYPEAMEYKHNGITAKGRLRIKFRGKFYRVRAIPDLIKNVFRRRFAKNYGMNPLDGWYSENAELREKMSSYFYTHIGAVEPWEELKNDTETLFEQGTVKEKIQAISLVGSISLLFDSAED